MRVFMMVICLWCVVACNNNTQQPSAVENDPKVPEDTNSGPAGSIEHEYAYLVDETEQLVAFLRGMGTLNTGLLNDSIVLYLAPDGGGKQRAMTLEQLKERSAWQLDNYSFVPPDGMKELTIQPGLHFNCKPMLLSNKFPELAKKPHVGARLAVSEEAGCLQTWNLTFVFNENPTTPHLIAVVYDQWEW